ncbi:phospholipase D family protein [Comamonas odontotermitis]|uniref:phospholipase D family protein n=1 Tax=Comamonas odontotermitis TaxID=379895 RepID=UPI001CC660BC|nr:phospholipase D family protein [Comamonas odontotermitis]UBB15394.1 phospholipase D family protein [Comamonas odontotermitis]
MLNVFANRTQRRDFVINELERRAVKDSEVFVAVAFFTEAAVVNRLVDKGCKVRLVVRLGFPTSPSAIEAVRRKVDLRVYTSTSFHPKLYIFGDEVALVGSANLTHSAITSNQEVMVGISGDDERFTELASIFQNYWDGADVPTEAMLQTYEVAYKKFEVHENAAEKLSHEIARQLGDTAPANIQRGEKIRSKQSLFLANYRRTYQEAVSAFSIVRRAYEATGYRKASEQDIPLRLEIDSFISFVRDTQATGESWAAGPFRTESEQIAFIADLVKHWAARKSPHFEGKIVSENYPRLMRVFGSRDAVIEASDDELFDALCTCHSFHDRLRFFDGGMPTWKKAFLAANNSERVRKSLAYLVFGEGDVIERMANMIYNEDYKLVEFGQSNVQELIGWRNKEALPVINGRTTKILRFFGSKVRQIS